MWRLLVVGAAALALGSCAVGGGGPSLSAGFSDASSGEAINQAPVPRTEAAPVKTASSDGSVLGNIWDNFSSQFKSGDSEPSAKQPEARQADQVGKPDADPEAALKLINAYRAKKALKPLVLDTRAAKAAAALANDMARHDKMSHTGTDGSDVGKRLETAGYTYRLAAENIGVGQTSLEQMVDSWKKSPPHSKNMLLKDAKHIGIAVEYKPSTKYRTFWALVIAAPR